MIGSIGWDNAGMLQFTGEGLMLLLFSNKHLKLHSNIAIISFLACKQIRSQAADGNLHNSDM